MNPDYHERESERFAELARMAGSERAATEYNALSAKHSAIVAEHFATEARAAERSSRSLLLVMSCMAAGVVVLALVLIALGALL